MRFMTIGTKFMKEKELFYKNKELKSLLPNVEKDTVDDHNSDEVVIWSSEYFNHQKLKND